MGEELLGGIAFDVRCLNSQSVDAHPRSDDVDYGPLRLRRASASQIQTFSRALHAPPGIESLDYDLHESPQMLSFVARQSEAMARGNFFFRMVGRETINWLVVCLAGFGTGLAATAINFGLMGFGELQDFIMKRSIKAGHGWLEPYFAFLAFRMSLASVAGALVCFVEPLAAGSGIPEIKSFLNGVNIPRVLAPKTLLAKAVGIMFSVGAGLPCGKEGPMIHSGAIFGSLASYAFSGSLLRPVNLDKEQRDLVAAGAAAGVSAAFSAPIGGVLFAIEEGATHMSVDIMLKTFVASACSALVVRFFASGSADHGWGLMGSAVPLDFGSLPTLSYHIWDLPIFAFIGVLGGLLGGLYNALNLKLSKWRQQHVGATGCKRFLEVLLLAAVIISLKFFIPIWTLGGVDKVPGSMEHVLWWGNQSGAIKALFHHSVDSSSLLALALVQFIIACWTYGAGIPSGLFVPILLMGAAFGKLFGQALLMLGVLELAEDTNKYALVGSVAALAGIARITISLSVIMLESIINNQYGIPLFLTSMVAKWVGQVFNPGIYDVHLELKHVPLLEPTGDKDMFRMQALDVMSQPVVSLRPSMTVGEIVDILQGSNHHGFPVADASGLFIGLVRRCELLHILESGKRCNFGENMRGGQGEDDSLLHPSSTSLSAQEILDALEPQDVDQKVNVIPYTNQAVYIIPEHATVLRCYALFRSMGLRHLPVVDVDSKLKGIITRKDLLFSHVHEQKWGGDAGDESQSDDCDESDGTDI